MSGHSGKVIEKLSETAVRGLLEGAARTVVTDIHILQTVDSTNTWLKQAAKNGAQNGTLVISEVQTDGRGRMGRSFYSPPHSGLYMSVLFKPCEDAHGGVFNPGLYTAAAAVAVTRALESVYGIAARIKWVNDVYYKGKKVCGILAEGVTKSGSGTPECIVTGIGVNIFTQDFPENLNHKVGSVIDGTKTSKNNLSGRNKCAACIVSHFFEFMSASNTAFMDEYREKSCVLGKKITVIETTDTYEARAVSIDGVGNLIVEGADGKLKTLYSGEISILGDF